jgi:hypothetical protein
VTRHYSSVASEKELASPVDGSTLSITLDNVTGLPGQFPYTLIVDVDTDDEEIVTVTNAAGTTLTVTRGEDGTVGLSHEQGAKVIHGMTARDLQESRDHEDATTNAHGVGSGNSVVGTNTVQTLEGKTIDGDDNTFLNIPQAVVTDLVDDQGDQDSAINANTGNISSLTTSFSNHENDQTNQHGVSEIVGRTEAQTLTNKTIDHNNNTLILPGGWEHIDFGTEDGVADWTVSGIPSGFEMLRLFARGNMSIASAFNIGMRFNATPGTYGFHLYEGEGFSRIDEGTGVSIPRIAVWDSSIACNFVVTIFAAGASDTPSWQCSAWRATGAGNPSFGYGERDGNLEVSSILISSAGTVDFDNVRWVLEGYRVP